MRIGEDRLLTERKWQAIIGNDASYDGKFFYAVKTTGIFCRPSCKSKPPRRENACVFGNAGQALQAGFRPCKRCKPTGERLPDNEWVAQITRYIDMHFRDSLTLHHLADACHGSPYHLHRTFRKSTGITPVAYIQSVRLNKAAQYLLQSDRTIADIAAEVGLPNTPYFITLFRTKIGFTPLRYRKLGRSGELPKPADKPEERGGT